MINYLKNEKRRICNEEPMSEIFGNVFLIVCEGEKTEPNYFISFPVDKKIIEVDIKGLGANTDSLVKKAIELKNSAIKSRSPYVQVWCVFDRDSFSPQNFNNAFALAEQNQIRIAYSNEAFELWYLLHFNYHDAGIAREQYVEKLDRLLEEKYLKNSELMYKKLLDKQESAIRNAKRLFNSYSPIFDPEKNNPSPRYFAW
jgi:hypothetical protein